VAREPTQEETATDVDLLGFLVDAAGTDCSGCRGDSFLAREKDYMSWRGGATSPRYREGLWGDGDEN
jgi:hypothetical protein